MDARPKRAVTIDELPDVAREVVRFVNQRRRRAAAAADEMQDDGAINDRDPPRTVH